MRNNILSFMCANMIFVGLTLTLSACTSGNMTYGQNAANPSFLGEDMSGRTMSGRSLHANLSNLNIDNRGNEVITKPSQVIQASTQWSYHCARCNPATNNQILVGIAGRSAQACIYDGGNSGSGVANFNIKTPAVPGTYEIRFRSAQAANCQEAMHGWWSMNGTPGGAATIGKIKVVKLKA